MKKLKEIVEVLSQIVALKCSTQDGGPGSGQKGHVTAENTPGKETLAQRQAVVVARNKTHGALSGMAVGKGEKPASPKLKHNNTPETLHNEGKGAARSQTKQADSPYEKGSPEHKHWLAGYKSYGHGGK